MDAQQLKQAGFNDNEIGEYTKLQSAGFTDTEISDHLSGKPSTVQPKQQGKSVGGFLMNAVQEVPELAKGVWETGKLASGMAALKPEAWKQAGNIVTGLPSAVADTAINIRDAVKEKGLGRASLDYIYEHPLTTAMNVSGGLGALGKGAKLAGLARTGEALASGSMYTNPITLASAPINVGVNALAKTGLPERLYGSAIKLPLSKKWLKELPREDINRRQRAVTAGLDENVPPSEYGAAKAKRLWTNSKNVVDGIVDDMTTKGVKFDTDKLLSEGLKDAYTKALDTNDSLGSTKIIDDFAAIYKANKGPTMTPREVQNNKRFNQKQANYEAQNTQGGDTQIKQSMYKGMANATMKALEEGTDLRSLNRTTSAYKDLEEAITRAYSREGNTNMAKLGTKILIGSTHPTLGILDHILGLPYVKYRLATAINQARKTPMTMTGNTGNVINAGYQAGRVIDQGGSQ
jgi:hypothetical protein